MKTILFLLLLLPHLLLAKSIVKESYIVTGNYQKYLPIFKSHPEIVLDHMNTISAEVYGPEGLGEWLDDLGVEFYSQALLNIEKNALGYPSPEEIQEKVEQLQKQYPNISRLEKIGTSLQGRGIWAIKISDNPEIDEVEPEIKYIANMHGDEIVGRELMVLLIEDLLKRYTNGEEEIVSLINNTEIYIVPSMNPDGAHKRRRGNNDWIDLNRDFPDFSTSDNQNTPHGREVETKAIMDWQKSRNFSLSANFHGGAEVVNYPWDTVGEQHPLHQWIVKVSREYAELVPGMRNSTRFPGGITNGYDWYEVNGGMQDWSYYWHNDLQITIELSNQKWPDYSQVARYWEENRQALINFLKNIRQGFGIKSKDKTGLVSINKVEAHEKKFVGTFNFTNGEFYKVLPEGKYQVQIQTRNKTKSLEISIFSRESPKYIKMQ